MAAFVIDWGWAFASAVLRTTDQDAIDGFERKDSIDLPDTVPPTLYVVRNDTFQRAGIPVRQAARLGIGEHVLDIPGQIAPIPDSVRKEFVLAEQPDLRKRPEHLIEG